VEQQRKGADGAPVRQWGEYLSLKELAQYLSIPWKTLEGWKARGYLPRHFVFGKRHHKWKRVEIDTWAEGYRFGGQGVA
jgi:excisionase family DNA binding protein